MTEVEEKLVNGDVPSEIAQQDIFSIQANGITKRFGPNVAVNDVSFNVSRGEVVGFLGPNGSGKTTTMRLLTSYYTPDSGSILIEGIDNQVDDMASRRLIGYLPENNPLYGDMLVREYLAFVAGVRGLGRQESTNNIDQAVHDMGIEDVFNRPVGQCSKGYKQRVGLAGAMLHKPEILIMDEPTEGLDPNQRVPIRELIKRIGNERTVLLSTHVLQEVEATCDRLLIISNGKIVGEGTPQDLLAKAKGNRHVRLEVEGDGVESALGRLKKVGSIEREEPVKGRQRYILDVAGGVDPRADIYQLAKSHDWILWELHEEASSLQDLFHSLTQTEA